MLRWALTMSDSEGPNVMMADGLKIAGRADRAATFSPSSLFCCIYYSQSTATTTSRQCHDALIHQTHSKGTVTPTTETGTAVVATTQAATDAAQTQTSATAPGTGGASQSGTCGELITTMTDKGGTTATTGRGEEMATIVTATMADSDDWTRAGTAADTRAETTLARTTTAQTRGRRGRRSTAIEATVCETTSATATAVTMATSAGALLH